jgi:diguanylate cyclase (GGDEF)-like protein/PAS domain S-box-containing protein
MRGSHLNVGKKARLIIGNLNVRNKLWLIVMATLTVALLGTCMAVLVYDRFSARDSMRKDLEVMADMMGANSTAALSFEDPQVAEEILSSLRAQNQIVAARISTIRGRLLASYRRTSDRPSGIPANTADGVRFESNRLVAFKSVLLDGRKLGSLYLESDLDQLHSRLRRSAGIMAAILIAAWLLGLALASRLQGMILDPITNLGRAARIVSLERNYSIRASKGENDEIGLLVDSFNEMLSQIEIQEQTNKMAKDALLESEERYALAVRGANDGLWDWKLNTGDIYFSSRWTCMLGYSDNERWSDPEEWLGRIHPADEARVRSQLAAHCKGVTPEFSSEYRIRDKDGRYIWMLSRGIAIRDSSGAAIRIAGSQTDITEGKTADPLTDLPNRSYFADKLESAIEESKNPGARLFAILFIDLDRFKIVNDSLGHAAGDELLRGIAGRLRSNLRGDAACERLSGTAFTVARLGGDEFAILLDGIEDETSVTKVAERILDLFAPAFNLGGHQVFASCSIGVAMGSSADTPDRLLQNADTAMYSAKTSGKNRYAVFNQAMRKQAIARMEIEAELKKAIEGNELELHYQPYVSLLDHRIAGFEALVRWNHPTRGLLYPGEFISVAEETGLIVPLGQWVLREACRQTAFWRRTIANVPALRTSVNVSYKQLAVPKLVEDVAHILLETGLDPSLLRLEMTESSIMENAKVATGVLQQFRDLKIGLEIDDFGTGYSSLGCLHQLPFNTVKIDQSFVKQLGTANDTSELIRTIIGLARSLNMSVVAEGVETKDQLTRLKAMGCDSAQGYYFSKPVNAKAAQTLILTGNRLRWEVPGGEMMASGIRALHEVHTRSPESVSDISDVPALQPA